MIARGLANEGAGSGLGKGGAALARWQPKRMTVHPVPCRAILPHGVPEFDWPVTVRYHPECWGVSPCLRPPFGTRLKVGRSRGP